MRLQDKYCYNATLIGLNNQYVTQADGSFYVNSPRIIVEDKTLYTGHTYTLVTFYDGDSIASEVVLIDVYHDNINLNMIVKDCRNYEIKRLKLFFDQYHEIQWLLNDQVDDL